MSEQLPNHDEQWDDMPLPNQEEAWQKMKRMLDREEDRRRFLPFWFWRYGVLGLLLLVTTAGGYWLLNRRTEDPAAGRSANENTSPPAATSREKTLPRSGKEIVETHEGPATNTAELRTTTKEKDKQSLTANEKTVTTKTAKERDKAITTNTETLEPAVVKTAVLDAKNVIDKIAGSPLNTSLPATSQGIAKKQRRQNKKHSSGAPIASETKLLSSSKHILVNKKEADNTTKWGNPSPARNPATVTAASDSLKEAVAKNIPEITNQKDTASAIKDTTKSAEPLAMSNEPKTRKAKKNNTLLFSAGVGLQQAIAFNGQQTSSYNLNGKQNSLSDKIPSVYLRLQKDQWFLQGEFHYGVPQAVESFAFSQTTAYNATAGELRTERAIVQKLYYHQLPLSINYFVLPQWSVGTGGAYNLLAGAVTEQETDLKNTLTGSGLSKSRVVPVKGFRDSFLYRSIIGVLLQTDYHWKRFSFGLRYTAGLQSFIKYTRPDGAVLDEKNQSLQVVLRFRVKG
jgi:hypothetical protein